MVIYSFLTSDPSFCQTQLRSKIIAVEGMPGAGKTTTLTSLAEQFEGTCILLSEVNLEPLSPKNSLPLDAKRALFHKLWLERLSLLSAFKNPNICFLLDRSHFSNLGFAYAFDRTHNTHFYPTYKKLFNESFKGYLIDRILVLDLSPEEGLKRRIARGDKISPPWSNISFLKAIREFFHKELPKIYRGSIVYINAHQEKNSLKREILDQILKVRGKGFALSCSSVLPNEEQINNLLAFAEFQNLGNAQTRVLNVLGRPTLYFLKHSIQLEKGKPVFLNNRQLYRLLRDHGL